MIGLVSLLQQEGYSVDLVSYIKSNFYSTLLEQNNINHIFLHVRDDKLSKLIAVRSLIKRNCYDCVIAYKDGPALISCILKLIIGKFRLIVSERNTTQVISKRERMKFWVYRYADYIVPNSISQEKFIKKNFSYLSKKTVTITNFTDTVFFSPLNNFHNNQMMILTAARIAKQKNILNYLECIRAVKEKAIKAKFVWYGDVQKGEEEYELICKNKIKELQIEDFFEFRPASHRIIDEYRNCDVFCLPSLYEGYPNVICEAMSCSKPILCSRVCDNSNIVEDEVNGYLFDPCNVEDMVNKILKMYNLSREVREKMGIKSREIAEFRFSPKGFVKKYIELIES